LFSVLLSRKAEKEISSLDAEIRSRVTALFEALEQSPVPAKQYDVAKIAGRNATYRIRLTKHRVLYHVEWTTQTITILKVERRSETTYA